MKEFIGYKEGDKKSTLTGDVAVVGDDQGKLPDGMLIGPAL
jgi:hypothetical protein